MLSEFERAYVVDGIEKDFRSDGRSCQDYRHFEVETGIVSNTSGSARLRLVSDLSHLTHDHPGYFTLICFIRYLVNYCYCEIRFFVTRRSNFCKKKL